MNEKKNARNLKHSYIVTTYMKLFQETNIFKQNDKKFP